MPVVLAPFKFSFIWLVAIIVMPVALVTFSLSRWVAAAAELKPLLSVETDTSCVECSGYLKLQLHTGVGSMSTPSPQCKQLTIWQKLASAGAGSVCAPSPQLTASIGLRPMASATWSDWDWPV